MPDAIFTIERLNWRRTAGGWLVLPGADRVATFADRAAAESDAREREWVVRRRVNPFHCGGPFLHYQTSFDAARLHDWFLDIGVEPPGVTADSATWADAWAHAQPHMSARQHAAAWESLDRVRFFRVTDGEVGRPLFLVARPHFEFDLLDFPRTTNSQYVGGIPYMLVRTRATADELCHTLYVDGIVREGGYVRPFVKDPTWASSDPDPVLQFEPEVRAEPVVPEYAEHRTLDLTAERPPTPGQTLFIVLRRHWLVEGLDGPAWRWTSTRKKTCGRAVAAFDTLAAADAQMTALEAEARHSPSPFRFGKPHGWSPLDATAIYGMLSDLAPIDFANLWNDYKADDSIWIGWWDSVLPSLTHDQIAMAWSLFEWLRFYEVVEVEYRA
jgi:hypothetical protein